MTGALKKKIISFAAHVGATFFAAFLGAASLHGVNDLSALTAAGAAGGVAAAMYIKSFLDDYLKPQ